MPERPARIDGGRPCGGLRAALDPGPERPRRTRLPLQQLPCSETNSLGLQAILPVRVTACWPSESWPVGSIESSVTSAEALPAPASASSAARLPAHRHPLRIGSPLSGEAIVRLRPPRG